MTTKSRFNLAYVAMATAGVLLLQAFWARSQAVAMLPYSEFQRLLREGQVSEVVVAAQTLEGELKAPLAEGADRGKRRFVTARVEPEMADELAKAGVRFRGQVESQLLPTLLSWIVPVLV